MLRSTLSHKRGQFTPELKHRQGQRGATPKPLCPKCNKILKRAYSRGMVDGKRKFIESGWICPSSTCDYIVKNLWTGLNEPVKS